MLNNSSLFLLITVILLTGCSDSNNKSSSMSNVKYTGEALSWIAEAAREGTPSYLAKSKYPKELANGKVQIDDDLYYVPIGKDKDGCMMYTSHSNNQATTASIIYRNKSGEFTSNKDTRYCTYNL